MCAGDGGIVGPFFFFKQKTAYEIGTGDWSSDGALPSSAMSHVIDMKGVTHPKGTQKIKVIDTGMNMMIDEATLDAQNDHQIEMTSIESIPLTQGIRLSSREVDI